MRLCLALSPRPSAITHKTRLSQLQLLLHSDDADVNPRKHILPSRIGVFFINGGSNDLNYHKPTNHKITFINPAEEYRLGSSTSILNIAKSENAETVNVDRETQLGGLAAGIAIRSWEGTNCK